MGQYFGDGPEWVRTYGDRPVSIPERCIWHFNGTRQFSEERKFRSRESIPYLFCANEKPIGFGIKDVESRRIEVDPDRFARIVVVLTGDCHRDLLVEDLDGG